MSTLCAPEGLDARAPASAGALGVACGRARRVALLCSRPTPARLKCIADRSAPGAVGRSSPTSRARTSSSAPSARARGTSTRGSASEPTPSAPPYSCTAWRASRARRPSSSRGA
eukprot:1114790-Prymnesium_polylepis.2